MQLCHALHIPLNGAIALREPNLWWRTITCSLSVIGCATIITIIDIMWSIIATSSIWLYQLLFTIMYYWYVTRYTHLCLSGGFVYWLHDWMWSFVIRYCDVELNHTYTHAADHIICRWLWLQQQQPFINGQFCCAAIITVDMHSYLELSHNSCYMVSRLCTFDIDGDQMLTARWYRSKDDEYDLRRRMKPMILIRLMHHSPLLLLLLLMEWMVNEWWIEARGIYRSNAPRSPPPHLFAPPLLTNWSWWWCTWCTQWTYNTRVPAIHITIIGVTGRVSIHTMRCCYYYLFSFFLLIMFTLPSFPTTCPICVCLNHRSWFSSIGNRSNKQSIDRSIASSHRSCDGFQ